MLVAGVLLFGAVGSFAQGYGAWLDGEVTLGTMSPEGRAALEASGAAMQAILPHLGCMHMVAASIQALAALAFGARERFLVLLVMSIYTASGIYHHYYMVEQAGGKVPGWSKDEETFWMPTKIMAGSTVINAFGLLGALHDCIVPQNQIFKAD
ncbi:unnamed protein product [Prorocentrum cordatum]|uniref:Uncharacterized protein n=1 Tax=Prorocentrum cordatum TaxID=2364126 RepID=A0ABN9V2T0_9DINO|nr:unnamed protein product [Polarella glacialis]